MRLNGRPRIKDKAGPAKMEKHKWNVRGGGETGKFIMDSAASRPSINDKLKITAVMTTPMHVMTENGRTTTIKIGSDDSEEGQRPGC